MGGGREGEINELERGLRDNGLEQVTRRPARRPKGVEGARKRFARGIIHGITDGAAGPSEKGGPKAAPIACLVVGRKGKVHPAYRPA